ncbi:MAG: hypothetical protein GY928_28435 [Colwellia sp.]|nr:hypothetical protein [Colwellia sp.]
MSKSYFSPDGETWQEIGESELKTINDNDRLTIPSARKNGKIFTRLQLLEELGPVRELEPVTELKPSRLCDCLKCRMGKFNECTTYSPRKHK